MCLLWLLFCLVSFHYELRSSLSSSSSHSSSCCCPCSSPFSLRSRFVQLPPLRSPRPSGSPHLRIRWSVTDRMAWQANGERPTRPLGMSRRRQREQISLSMTARWRQPLVFVGSFFGFLISCLFYVVCFFFPSWGHCFLSVFLLLFSLFRSFSVSVSFPLCGLSGIIFLCHPLLVLLLVCSVLPPNFPGLPHFLLLPLPVSSSFPTSWCSHHHFLYHSFMVFVLLLLLPFQLFAICYLPLSFSWSSPSLGKHYCPRMATMNKPTYASITTYSPRKPALVFVSSRRQTRLTALDLISFAAQDDQRMRVSDEEDEELVEKEEREEEEKKKKKKKERKKGSVRMINRRTKAEIAVSPLLLSMSDWLIGSLQAIRHKTTSLVPPHPTPTEEARTEGAEEGGNNELRSDSFAASIVMIWNWHFTRGVHRPFRMITVGEFKWVSMQSSWLDTLLPHLLPVTISVSISLGRSALLNSNESILQSLDSTFRVPRCLSLKLHQSIANFRRSRFVKGRESISNRQ